MTEVEELYRLAWLLTGQSEASIRIAVAGLGWPRRVVMAGALEWIRQELAVSARKLGEQSASLAGEWDADSGSASCQLERALLAMDVFPRCVLVLTVFERVSVGDAAVMLDMSPDLVRKGQRIGLRELTRKLILHREEPIGLKSILIAS